MKKMLKLISLFFAALFLLIPLLSSCHGIETHQSFYLPPEFDTSREYNLTFWAKNDSNPTQQSIYKQAIAEFEELYPNIHIKLVPYTDYGRIYSDVITNISTGTTPNICITYPDHVATYNSGGELVVNLNNLLTDTKYGLGGSELRFEAPLYEEMEQKFLSECYLGDGCYALPFMRSTEACYVNVDYVEALGYTLPETLTWDFIFEVSMAAMEKDENGNFKLNGTTTLIPFIYKSTDNMMIQMLAQKGADYSDENGNILIFNEDTKEILYSITEPAGAKAFSTFAISSYPGNWLNAGQCIFAIDSTAGATWMGTNSPNQDISKDDIKELNIKVMAIPQYDTENPKMISQGPSICLFNKEDPQEVMASWLFMQYLVSDKVQMAYAKTEGYVPVTTTAQSNPEYLDYLSRSGEDNDLYYSIKIDATKLLLENTENTFITPVFNGSASLRNVAGQLIEEVTKRMRRKKGVTDKYLEDELYPEMISQYKLDMSKDPAVRSEEKSEIYKDNLGPLPRESIVLLSVIGAIWVAIGAYFGINMLYKKKKSKKI